MARKRKRRRRSRGGGGGPRLHSLKDKAYVAAGAAAYGYVDNHVEAMEKLPVLGTSRTARAASHALALHAGASIAKGQLRKWLDLASVGAAAIAGYNVGKAKGDMAALEGVDDEDDVLHLEGDIPVDDGDD